MIDWEGMILARQEARELWEDDPDGFVANFGPDAIPPEDLEYMDEDLTEALMNPEEYLRKLDERLMIWSQDAEELDPAELWKGFGI